ncbi:MAG: mannosyltransferase family protein, partial [Acidimicrobiia bacterium]|nr:mannosyltransferase family protein [Acidimicrobiia bacterium]
MIPRRAEPVLVWAAAAAIAAVVGWFSLSHMRLAPAFPWQAFPDELWLDGFSRWDSFWYRSIADGGYGFTLGDQSNYAFFPGYPIAMWALGTIVRDFDLGGILSSSAFAIGSLYLFRAWIEEIAPDSASIGGVVALALGPSAFYLAGVAYSESLFLISALAAFLLLERGRPLAASLVAIPALVTRPVGIALVVALLLRSV